MDIDKVTSYEERAEQNDAVQWWTQVKAALRLDVPYTSMFQGDTPALIPEAPPTDDPLLALFPEEMERLHQHPRRFHVSARVVRLNKLQQIIWQVRHYWKLDPHDAQEAEPSVRFDFENGHYVFTVASCTFILPTESEVRAAHATGEDFGE